MSQILVEIPIPFLGWRIPVFGFGVMMIVAFFTADWLLVKLARGKNLDIERVLNLARWMFIAGISGARAFFIAENPQMFHGCLDCFKIWQGGLVFYGGTIAALVVFVLYAWWHTLPALRVLDVMAPPIALGTSIGRIGCLLNGCCWGKPSDLPWAVRFPAGSIPWRDQVKHGWLSSNAAMSLPVHPTQLYLGLAALLLVATTLTCSSCRTRDGQVAIVLAAGYALTRFFIEFMRGDVAILTDGLTISQNISLLLLAAATAAWVYLRLRPQPVAFKAVGLVERHV